MTGQLLSYTKATGNNRDSTQPKKGRAPRKSKRFETVSRPRLVQAASDYLARDGMLALCSERGMGRHVLASDIAKRHRSLHGKVSPLRIVSASQENSCRRVRSCVNDAIETTRGGDVVLVVAEGIKGMDDIYLARMARCFEAAVENGCQVLFIANPEAEPLFDHLPGCHVLRAKDLALEEEEYFAWGNLAAGYPPEMITRATHGIPALVATLKNTRPALSGAPTGTHWDRAVDALMRDALRPSLIEEEQRMRCAMAALGSGDINELNNLGVRASYDLLEETANMAPLFGADARRGSFGLVPCDANMVVRTINESCANAHALLCSTIHALVRRGNIGRAARLAQALDDPHELTKIVYAHPLELIDEGLSSLVNQVLEQAPESKEAVQICEVLNLLGAGAVLPKNFLLANEDVPSQSFELAFQIELLRMARRLITEGPTALTSSEGRLEELHKQAIKSGVRTTRVLGCYLWVLRLVCRGRYMDAYRELVLYHALRSQHEGAQSLFSALLQYIFEGLRLLVGDPETARDKKEHARACAIIDANAKLGPCKIVSAWRAIALGITSHADVTQDASFLISHYARRKEMAALAIVNLCASLFSSANLSYRQAYVFANEAAKYAQLTSQADVVVLAGIAQHIALTTLGELGTCKMQDALDATVALDMLSGDIRTLAGLYYAIAGEDTPDKNPVSKGNLLIKFRQELEGAPPHVIALARLIARCDMVQGQDLLRAFPSSWREERIALAPVTALAPSANPSLPDVAAKHSSASLPPALPHEFYGQGQPIMEVNVLCPLCVKLNGQYLPESQWRRNRSRMLMAYLALKPGHSASRAEIIEQLWPNVDFQHGRDNLYTTLSSLRSAIGQTAEGLKFVVGEMGRIWLDRSLVSCDVDAFEERVRLIVMHEISDAEIISSCMHLEELYGSGSYIPTQDISGFFKSRHEELENRYVEAMLYGANAAVRVGDQAQAKWFGSVAAALKAKKH